jgi:phosphatidylserine/phosphatidylglycerophosphate/cardiolipin synthase-like enzyme
MAAFSLTFQFATVQATVISGTDWKVIWNLPDQDSSVNFPGEFDIRNALVNRINALGSGNSAFLSTFTASGNSTGFGSILTAIYNKLNDATLSNVTIRMNIDAGINPNWTFNNGSSSPFYSIAGLASTVFPNGNAFYYDRGTYTTGIMHNKFSLFDYGPGNRWINTGSWNYTGGASIYQWNITYEIRNDALYNLFLGEANQLMGSDTITNDGIYHNNPLKSHAFDSPPVIPFDGGNGLIGVRFGPHPNSTVPNGDNATSSIISAIQSAQYSILLGVNKLSSMAIANELITACNNGVEVHLIISQSDIAGPFPTSQAVYNHLNNPSNYANMAAFNRFHTYIADTDASTPGLQPDTPSFTDLVHTKYIVIDAGTPNAQVIHGSANLTNTALHGTSENDENILFIKHQPTANAFVQHAQAMTAGQIPALPVPEPSAWLLIVLGIPLLALHKFLPNHSSITKN